MQRCSSVVLVLIPLIRITPVLKTRVNIMGRYFSFYMMTNYWKSKVFNGN